MKKPKNDTKANKYKSAKGGNLKDVLGGGANKTQTTNNEMRKDEMIKEGKTGPDMNLLDKLSEEYILSPRSFQIIEKVELKLVTLSEQLTLAKDEDTKVLISDLIDRYQLQQKRLLKKQAVEKAKENSDKEVQDTKSSNTPITYEINENNEMVELTPKRNETSNSNKNSDGFTTPTRNKSKPSDISSTGRRNNAESTKRKHNNSEEKKQEDKSNKKNSWNLANKREFTSAAVELFKSGNEMEPNNDSKQNKTKNANQIKGFICLRLQFKAKTRKNNTALKHEAILSNLLYEIMQCSKIIDKESSLMPWSDVSTLGALNGNELRLHMGEKINEYIHIPELKDNLIEGKVYYQNGIRIKTQMTVYEFTERWSNMRYNKDENRPKIEWTPIKPAEMQSSDQAYPIGYFTGTTERGDYRTLNKTISEITDTNTEVSFQFVNQSGITPKIWQFARERAEMASDDPRSKLHKRTKFKYAPSALTVYVSDKAAIKEARRVLIKKYGKLEHGLWPVMPDGSRMRFVPIIFGNINENSINKKKQKVYKHLYDQMVLQSSSKAGEVLLDLEMWDLYNRPDYLKGSTLEEVIHGLTSTTKAGIPIFKHITRKWTRNPDEENYEVAVAPSMLREAQETLRTIRPALKRKFGLQMNNHFRPQQAPKLLNTSE